MNPQERKYYVLIVHFGNRDYTDQAVQSLSSFEHPPDEIIVADHCDTPYHHPKVTIIRPRDNRGYAAGLNVGLGSLIAKQAREEDIVVCMNNDLKILPGSFEALRQWWSGHTSDAILGASIHEDHTVINGGYVNLLTGRTNLVNYPVVSSIFKISYLHGSFISAPYRVFLRCGLWPEQYFMYWEDVLLCVKANRLGIPLLTTDNVHVMHRAANSLDDKKLYYLVRNGAMFLAKETKQPWRTYWWLLNRIRFVWHEINPNHRTVAYALHDAIVGTSGKRKLNSDY